MGAFNFIGPAYTAANPMQDAQQLINWYLEIDPNPDAKSPVALLGCPGLVSVAVGPSGGEVRGMWELPGNTRSVVVIGNTAYLFDGAILTKIGMLATSSGKVSMRDNGPAKIVAIADGSAIYSYNLTSTAWNVFGTPASRIAFIDGWFVFNDPGSQKFYTSPLYWNGSDPFDATYFALKDSSSDNLISHIENNRELWLIGERTTEIWYDAGNQYFPFSRLQGATIEIGCAAKHTLCKTGKGLIWLARSNRGENLVVMTQDYQYNPVTTPAIAYAISQYATVDDAFAYVYTEEGHSFYVLTFPTADATWVYDLTTNVWHQRARWDADSGTFRRHKSNCAMNLAGTIYVGDYSNGTIWNMTRKAYTDGPDMLIARRRTPHVWDKGERNRVKNTWLQIEFTPGQGLNDGQGSDPQAMMRMSNDGGFTWGNEHSRSIGRIGEYLRRAIWRQLGMARDRVYEVSISDPVPRDVVGATLRGGETRA
jgi:hypothetical protein